MPTRMLLLALARGGGSVPGPQSLFGFYNGRIGVNPQQILGMTSDDGGRTATSEIGATFVVSGPGGLYDAHVAQCCVFERSPTEFVVYLSGYDGLNWRIFRFTSSSLTADPLSWFIDNGGNAVIDLGAGGDPDDDGANFPQVEYDADLDIERIWYTGWKAGGFLTICYAERDSGGTFTKYGRMLNVGAGGAFDDGGLETGPPITIDGEKRIYYDGYDGAEYSQSYATYTNPRSAATYTKHAALPTLTGPLSVDEGAYGSVHIHSMVPRASGGWIAMVTLFHPVGSGNQREISCYSATNDGITFTSPIGPIIPMSTTYPDQESRENPAVLVTS